MRYLWNCIKEKITQITITKDYCCEIKNTTLTFVEISSSPDIIGEDFMDDSANPSKDARIGLS